MPPGDSRRATEQQRVAVRRRSRLGASNDDVGIEKARLLHGETLLSSAVCHEDESENPVFAARKTPRHGLGRTLTHAWRPLLFRACGTNGGNGVEGATDSGNRNARPLGDVVIVGCESTT